MSRRARLPRNGDVMTGIQRLEHDQVVSRPLREVFEFFSRAENLERITPPWLRFRLLTSPGVEMRAGVNIEYRLRLRGIPLGWTSLIEVWERDVRFVDLQIRGPYRLWRHEHRFTAVADGASTRVQDRVDYLLPFGWAGNLALPLVRHDLRRIFDYREAAVPRLLG
jgi:ligand-binding SRPBCC domain-containing protein